MTKYQRIFVVILYTMYALVFGAFLFGLFDMLGQLSVWVINNYPIMTGLLGAFSLYVGVTILLGKE